MKGFLCWMAAAGFLVAGALYEAAHGQEQPNPVQDQIEKTIGSLVVRNAQCSAQTLQQASQIADLKKQVEDLKAKK